MSGFAQRSQFVDEPRTIESALASLTDAMDQNNPFNWGYKQKAQSESRANIVDKSKQAREEAIRVSE